MNNQMLKVAIILGSTRPGRNGEAISRWIHDIAKKRSDANFELVDIKDFNLPLLDESISAAASMGQYSKEHTKTWSAKIDSFDAYVFVTAEYNHGIPGALKNAIDFLSRNGIIRLQDLSVMVAPVGCVQWNNYVWSWQS
jgi:NAD(P)H-dependent FMN reductase